MSGAVEHVRLAATLAGVALLAACALPPAGPPPDIVWSGEVRIAGQQVIPKGRTLVIRPGTRVLFDFVDADRDGKGDAGLLVQGSVVAEGTPEAPIVFAPAAPRPGAAWSEVRVEGGGRALFAECRFTGAQSAVHAHLTTLLVERCAFTRNEMGVRFRGGPVIVRGSRFRGNGTAVRYWESDPLIEGNHFAENGTAVFCRESSTGSVLRANNFTSSADYHVKLGESQPGDVDARGNWWGTVDEAEIDRLIFDRADAHYLGRVIVRPFETEPLPEPGTAPTGEDD